MTFDPRAPWPELDTEPRASDSSQQAAPVSGARMGARAARAFAGHPVDVATGEQFTAAHDVKVSGVTPLIFRRVYNTTFLERAPGSLGPGWVHAFEASLVRDLDGYVFEGHDGDRVEFDDVDGRFARAALGARLINRSAGMELRREGERLVVLHWHDPEDPVQKYVFNPGGDDRMHLVARVLPSGQGLRIERDRRGRAVRVTQTTERRQLHLGYDEAGLLATLHLGIASDAAREPRLVASYEYDSRSRLVAVYDALGAARRYEYDDQHRLIAERGRRGGVFRMRYDAAGRCIETTGEGRYFECTFRYEPGRTRVANSLGHETVYEYNDRGQVERRILPNGATFATELDDDGRIVGELDPLGNATRYRYDDVGRLAQRIFPNGAKVSYEYDADHQPTRITEPDGAVWELTYERGALVEVKDPFERRTIYQRGRENELLGAFTSSGQELRITKDDHGTEEVVADQLGTLRQRSLDLYRRPTHTRDAQGPISRAEYDVLGRVVVVEKPDGASRRLEYDAEGALTQVTDARGGVWRARYTAYGECIERLDPLGRRHQYGWDTEGRLTSITNPKGETARFEYDVVGNLVSVHHFDGSREEASYDLAARLIGRRRRDGTLLRFQRDAVGNLLKQSVVDRDGAETPLRSFKYDIRGRTLEAASPGAHVAYEYDVGGRMRAEIQNGRRIDYAFDERGYIRERAFQGSLTGPIAFDYDARGRIRRFSAQSGAGQVYEYDLRDQCTKRVLELTPGSYVGLSELEETRNYDLQGRLRHQSVGKLTARTYQYDSEGSLIELIDQHRGVRRYEYDAADQLRSSVGGELDAHIYDYDANGNLQAKTFETLEYAEGNRLERMSSRRDRTVFERNQNAEVLRQTSADRDDRYTWDALGQLTRVSHRDGSETRFQYDALGRRVSKEHRESPIETGNGRRTLYFWMGDDLLAEQCDDVLTEYAAWSFVADALWENGKIRHVISSRQGVPQELIDERGRLAWRGTFDDWGKLIAQDGKTTCRLRLPGQLFDEETGLHYNRFRYYSPDSGQFISPDPIGYERSKNLFRFAPNTIGWLDPLGLECWAHVAQEEGAQRRAPTDGDADLPSRDAAMAEALRRHGIDPETVEVTQMYGNNPNLVGPKGQPWERISGLNAAGDIVTFDHHANGHYFRDSGEYELPHFHGPNGEHLCY